MSNARFSILQSKAVEDARISNSQFRTLAALGTFGDKDGWCFPKLNTMGKMLNKSKQAVSKDLQVLGELGYIDITPQYREDGSRQNNLYRLLFDTRQSDIDTPSTPEVDTRQPNAVDTPSTPEVDALTPHLTPHPDAPKESKAGGAIPSYYPTAILSVFTEVTGMLAFPGRERKEVEPILNTLISHHGEGTADYLRPFWKEWLKRKYRKTNCAWLTEWAISGEIPTEKKSGDYIKSKQAAALAALERMED